MLFQPLGRHHLMLSFESPAVIRRIRLTGPSLAGAEIFVGAIDPKAGFDNGALHPLGSARGQNLQWGLEGQPFARGVTSLRIVPTVSAGMFSKPPKTMTLAIDFDRPAIQW